MSKETVHFEALGFEPFRMKPVHFASGFFLSVAGASYTLETLNKLSVIKHKTGLRQEYAPDTLLAALQSAELIEPGVSEAELKLLRMQINGVMDNDSAVFAAFRPYKKPFGNDYTLVSDRFLTNEARLDGYSGHFIHQVLETTPEGRGVAEFARACIEHHGSPLEQLVGPLLDADELKTDWTNPYPQKFGELSADRLASAATLMSRQTAALAQLCRNLERGMSHQTKLRGLVIGLCSWLFIYLQKVAARAKGSEAKTPILLSDFLGGKNERLRALSRICFARHRQLVFESYRAMWKASALDCTADDFEAVAESRFKFLDEHFSDLAIRIGFAQPRAYQARRKHFELQPDTARLLCASILGNDDVWQFERLAAELRATWGICVGACDDDLAVLRSEGYEGLDDDDDLSPNRDALISLLKTLNIAAEPSDGLVLCSLSSEALV
jgi:hypothetical protein